MRGIGAQIALIGTLVRAAAGASVDISSDTSTAWGAPGIMKRCPLHKDFSIRIEADGVDLDPPGGGRFSVAQKEIPAAGKAILGESTGLILRYTSPPGASGLSLWRVRVTSETDPSVRFAHLFSIPANGVKNETRYMPWEDFHGQITDRDTTKIKDCRKTSDPRCTINRTSLTHVSFLESEDTIAHAIRLHEVLVVTYPIAEQNVEQHHTEEQAALIWEREHAAQNVQDFWFNGTHWQVGGNCTNPMRVCIVTDATTGETTTAPMTTPAATGGTSLNVAAASGAPVEKSRYLWAIATTVFSFVLCGH